MEYRDTAMFGPVFVDMIESGELPDAVATTRFLAARTIFPPESAEGDDAPNIDPIVLPRRE